MLQGRSLWLNTFNVTYSADVGEVFGHLAWSSKREKVPDMDDHFGSIEGAQYTNAMLLSVFSQLDTWPLAFLPNAFMYVLGMILFATMDVEGQSTWCWTGLIYSLHSIVRPYYMEERTGKEYGWAADRAVLKRISRYLLRRRSGGRQDRFQGAANRG